jgi:hypothetical protein
MLLPQNNINKYDMYNKYKKDSINTKITIFVFTVLTSVLLFMSGIFQVSLAVKYFNSIYNDTVPANRIKINFAIYAMICHGLSVLYSIVHFAIGWKSAVLHFRDNIGKTCINIVDIVLSGGLVLCMIFIALLVSPIPIFGIFYVEGYENICEIAWTVFVCSLLVEISAIVRYSCA